LNNYLDSTKASVFEHYKEIRDRCGKVTAPALKDAFLGIEKEVDNRVGQPHAFINKHI